jgi:hypothetical protein
MRKMLILVVLSLAVSCLAQEQDIPTRRILPEDISQDSIRLLQASTNCFVVRWTYTEEGAKKMLVFIETHRGQKTRTMIGSYESPITEGEYFRPVSPTFTPYDQWKAGWLKRRTDKVVGVSEVDAKNIVAGLKNK